MNPELLALGIGIAVVLTAGGVAYGIGSTAVDDILNPNKPATDYTPILYLGIGVTAWYLLSKS